jgi:prepilin-type N-terminal cleavage/methylation domain-containing protein
MRRERGFTLLEILVAIAIFTFVAAAAMATMANSDQMAAAGRRARDLRMLAEVRMGEVLAFEKHWDEQGVGYEGDFGDHPEWGERFKDWKWQLDIRDVYVFGIASEDDAQYLFGQPTDDEKAEAASSQSQGSGAQSGGTGAGGGGTGTGGSGGSGGSTKKQGDPQKLRELTLRVSSPADEGAADSVELIVFAPTLPPATSK